MRLIDADRLLEQIDAERKYLIKRGQTGAEHILVHNFRDLVLNALTIKPTTLTCDGCKHVGTYDTDFPCSVCIRREKDYYVQEQ